MQSNIIFNIYISEDIIIRFLFFSRFVFLEGSYDSGHLSHPEYALMKKWYEFAADKFEKQVKPDLIG